MAANIITGVREYGLGRHLWALKPEQVVGFEKVEAIFNLLGASAHCILTPQQ